MANADSKVQHSHLSREGAQSEDLMNMGRLDAAIQRVKLCTRIRSTGGTVGTGGSDP